MSWKAKKKEEEVGDAAVKDDAGNDGVDDET